MARRLKQLEQHYQLIVVGGGIYGAACAYFAARNGYTTLLLEQADFASATTANSQGVIHGGFRYLQRLNLPRVVQSIRAKRRFLNAFPHLVARQPSRLALREIASHKAVFMGLACRLYNLLHYLTDRYDRVAYDPANKAYVDKGNKQTRQHSSTATTDKAVVWQDGLSYASQRIVWLTLQWARQQGAVALNYVKVIDIDDANDTLKVTVDDRISEQRITLTSDKVLLCTGADFAQGFSIGKADSSEYGVAMGNNIIVTMRHRAAYSEAMKASDDAQQNLQNGLLFTVPWRSKFNLGTRWQYLNKTKTTSATRTSAEHSSSPSSVSSPVLGPNLNIRPSNDQIAAFIAATPTSWRTQLQRIHQISIGRLAVKANTNGEVQLLNRMAMLDLQQPAQSRVMQLISVKLTSAFDDALLALEQLMQRPLKQRELPINNAINTTSIDQLEPVIGDWLIQLFADQAASVWQRYGNGTSQSFADAVDTLVPYFMDHEMVYSLDDLLRRALLDIEQCPSSSQLGRWANTMAMHGNWSFDRIQQEISAVEGRPNYGLDEAMAQLNR